jgi:hypothetical protein
VELIFSLGSFMINPPVNRFFVAARRDHLLTIYRLRVNLFIIEAPMFYVLRAGGDWINGPRPISLVCYCSSSIDNSFNLCSEISS